MREIKTKKRLTSNNLIKKIIPPMQWFIKLESSGGIVLLVATVIALLIANSPLKGLYSFLLDYKIILWPEFEALNKTVSFWINDGLMVLFFFVVSLEIKREILYGELKSIKKTFLPVAAALGGMLVPMTIYLAFNKGTLGAPGWGIPMATDIAFSIGILSILGKRVPNSLKVFLTALAIIDDIGAVIVIAIFYTSEISFLSLGIACSLVLILVLINKAGIKNGYVYFILGVCLWLSFLSSGVHPTIAGVLLAFTIPAKRDPNVSFLHKIETKFHPYVVYLIMPVFAFANAGVNFGTGFINSLTSSVSLGIIFGLIFGKKIGILLFSYLSVKLKLAALPKGVSWIQIYGVGWIAGIGFTMSLFIANLAFNGNSGLLTDAKVGILSASLIAGILGTVILIFLTKIHAKKK